MNIINKRLKLNITDQSGQIDRTIYYFEKSGFKLLEHSANKVVFNRGSIFSNMWTFNPLKWKSKVSVEINENQLNADFNIDHIGQMPTQKEEELWNIFIANYQLYLADPNFNFKTQNQYSLNTTKKSSLKYIGWAILGGLVGGLPAGLIAYWTGINSIVFIGAAGGAIGLMATKINEEKKRPTTT